MSTPQTVAADTVDDLVGQAIRQLTKLDRADLAAAVQAALRGEAPNIPFLAAPVVSIAGEGPKLTIAVEQKKR